MYRLTIAPTQIDKHDIVLTSSQRHYLLNVLRLQTGNRFMAINGRGEAWIAEIAGNAAKILKEIAVDTELPIAITLITALPKSNGYEQIVRCCTELGVSNFYPVISDRTILKPSANKVERWRKIATEAAEQSERAIVPQIFPPVTWQKVLGNTVDLNQKFICVARGRVPALWQCLQTASEPELVIATGCEGGWTEAEIKAAIAVGYQPVTLGSRILRAVTAPITALSIAAAILEQNNRGTSKLNN